MSAWLAILLVAGAYLWGFWLGMRVQRTRERQRVESERISVWISANEIRKTLGYRLDDER